MAKQESPHRHGMRGWAQGRYSLQPHVGVPSGTFEEEHGRAGFYGRASHLYHRHPPTGWLRIEGPLKPRSYYAIEAKGLVSTQPEILLRNEDVQVGCSSFDVGNPVFFRNADEDEIRFVDRGEGCLQTDYGDLEYSAGDFLVIPRGTSYRFVPSSQNVQFVILSASEVGIPERGMLGRHAFFDPMAMRVPRLPEELRTDGANAQGEFELRVKRQGVWTKLFYAWNPIDVAGWKGDLAPSAINVDDMRPVVSERVILPPSAYTTFEGNNFIVCTFLPRPSVKEEGAEKVPFYHRNIDYDEILFHHHGKFSKRTDLDRGRMVWHPQGIHHGPHPTSAANACPIRIEEIAVMVDTFKPLQPTVFAESIEDPGYPMSWAADAKR
jgi:homogentisate 1,2-dioxygenase